MIRGLSGKERHDLIKGCGDKDDMLDNYKLTVLSLSRCVFDPQTDERIFTDQQAELVMKKAAKSLQIIIEAMNDLNGFTDAVVEDIEKN